jgi:hypothetical protein
MYTLIAGTGVVGQVQLPMEEGLVEEGIRLVVTPLFVVCVVSGLLSNETHVL